MLTYQQNGLNVSSGALAACAGDGRLPSKEWQHVGVRNIQNASDLPLLKIAHHLQSCVCMEKRLKPHLGKDGGHEPAETSSHVSLARVFCAQLSEARHGL